MTITMTRYLRLAGDNDDVDDNDNDGCVLQDAVDADAADTSSTGDSQHHNLAAHNTIDLVKEFHNEA